MSLLFEDSTDSVLSKFVAKALGAIPMVNCHNLENYSYGSGDVAFYDVSPDNDKTVERFIALREEYGSAVRPVPCSEFPVIFLLLSIGFKMSSNDLDALLGSISGNSVSYSDKSYEKFCKRVLGEFGIRCVVDSGKFGEFYSVNCICERKKLYKCSVEHSVSLDNKYLEYKRYCPGLWEMDDTITLYSNLFSALGKDSTIFIEVLKNV